mmetsp:Transcript_21157/g.31373  ORF Transcript_21157/g.31373 Transcript_21157/m.31373 type:complete len:433 (+) Transcript_21157:200-1498(+)|eukprot:CAMPEP_0194213320 /NCGR_PEP_ID=MMETSP0156-20130528/13781_1 /TAXON_ID=33649 /ORGANISM="Thalassionema nitzschioides, Strain L26-B" /LENGTH=432 /DNA_ID=CAMNT_0038941313 /DNA_START=128 /DNA_END=1426 /DNA_ORIENTATION=-
MVMRRSVFLACRQISFNGRVRMLSDLAPVPTSSSLVDFQTSAKIEGEETQVATITLQPGQAIRAESGSLVFMTSSIQMETSSTMSDGMKRFMTGQALFVTDFTAKDTTGQVALAPAFPSKVLRLNIQEYGGEIICQKGAYVASNVGVNIDLAFTKNFSSGFFGGEGFVLQKLTGEGDVLLQASGALIRKDLDDGEELRVSSGTLVCFTNTIDYDVQMMPGFKNVMFGGEGLFVTTLKGPGTVWLQGMPPDRMISEIARKVPGGGIGLGIPIGVGSGGGAEDAAAGVGVEGDGSEAIAASDTGALTEESSSPGSTSENIDTDSPNALFGDAAVNESIPGSAATKQSTETSQDPFYDSENTSDQQGFSDETTFSTENEMNEFDDFADDNTSFSTYEGDASSSIGDGIGAEDIDTESVAESAKNILSTLWDMFRD